MEFTLSEHVAASPERCFHVATDLEAAGAWMNDLVRIERLDDGPLKAGSEFLETRKMFGREATEHFEVVAVEEPSRVSLRVDGSKGTSGRGEYLYTYRFAPEGDGTRVDLDCEVRGSGVVMGLMMKLMSGSFRGALEKDLASMKAYAERRAS